MFAIVLRAGAWRAPTRARWMASIAGSSASSCWCGRVGRVPSRGGLLVLAAISNALYQLLTRRLPGDSPYTTLFYSALVGAVGLTAACRSWDAQRHGLDDVLHPRVLGLLAGLGTGC
jgi:drug/metabolite transporter (DMT)-like permease